MRPLSEREKKWALSYADYADARDYYGRKTAIYQVIIATVNNGWQVLRHVYIYARYRYKKLHSVRYRIVMEEWMKGGEYVFLSLGRFGQCYVDDAWVYCGLLEVTRGYCGGFHCDPRELSYTAFLPVRLLKDYRYLPEDICERFPIHYVFRAINANPYNETLLKNDGELFKRSLRNDYAFDREKSNAIKIAQRYGYKINDIWFDMVDSLAYLRKDLHNPLLVCPSNIMEAHDRWCAAAGRKRKKVSDKMAKLRQIRTEKEELRRLQWEAEREKREKEESKAAVSLYNKARSRFFGLLIAKGDIEIRVLKSVEEFMEEGKAMQHCVFSNKYYDVKKRPYCLILSARVGGERAETIEVDLKDYTIVQCRGKHNQSTSYHDAIMRLVEDNMGRIKSINQRKKRTRKSKINVGCQ